MNADLVIPADEEAERTVAGCVADNVHASVLAHQRLNVGDFYIPACRRIFEAAATVGWALPLAERVARVADKAMVDKAEVWAMVRGRGVMVDTSGSYARRVRDASRRRRVMAVAAEVYNSLGDGGTLVEAVRTLGLVLRDVGADESIIYRPERLPA